jgi:hypothetical protein
VTTEVASKNSREPVRARLTIALMPPIKLQRGRVGIASALLNSRREKFRGHSLGPGLPWNKISKPLTDLFHWSR